HVIQGLDYVNVPNDITLDIVIICKWHHFYDGTFAEKAREKYQCPVFLWVWDYMYGDYDQKFPEWHIKMILGSDLYLGNDVRLTTPYEQAGVPRQKLYYFPFDVSSKEFKKVDMEKEYEVVFFGSHFPKGDRVEWLKAINQVYPVKIFASNPEEWRKIGFVDAEEAVYGREFAQAVAKSKIILGFNVNDYCWGYWSNRVGKVLTVGGFLLYHWVPGMELFLRDGAEYFSSVDEAIQKIAYYLGNPKKRFAIAKRGYQIGRDRFTSQARIKELMILIERYKKGAFLR
ncbi:MAG: glycosyltransferase, partial [Candidatus Daviesbacteria bacterium]|nr:glycosyltransferase [Candidatus Daviesbacteria bacterium]